jgi:nickel/cobalt exporter
MRRLLGRSLLGASLATFVFAASAMAHPLGNFTINHYSGVRVSTDGVLVDHVTDFAEIPAFSERRAMDTDSNGEVSAAEAAAFESARCASLAGDLHLTVGGSALPLSLAQSGISFPMGQGNVTMRLVCVYSAPLSTPLSSATSATFEDASYAERQGWREIVVQGDGATVIASDAPAEGTSDRLTVYPTDLLAIPLGHSKAIFEVRPGGAALPAFAVPDAHPVNGSTPAAPVEAPPVAAAPEQAVTPAGVGDLGADVTALFQAQDLSLPVILLGLLVAAGLGALHAVSPGHGKTVMAAYLVGSRGNMRHAVGLGLTVTVSHTLGVLALGALSFSAATFIAPEKLYPILSVASGAIVVVIGGYLLLSRLRAWQVERASQHEHDRAHAHGMEHSHEHEHQHDQADVHGQPHAHAAAHEDRPAGWHDHGGIGHTHLPKEGMGWKGLFALGLSGGMIPSVSALLILIGSISIGRPLYGIVLTVAFGLGMAAVLVGVGLAFVYARRLVERTRFAMPLQVGKWLPVGTAVVVLVAGVLITGQGIAGLR